MVSNTTVRLALSNYHDNLALAHSDLARSAAVKASLLDGDSENMLGFAVRATLDWALGRLRQIDKDHAQVSYDLLVKRYLEGMSASAYADLYLISDATSQSRRKAAVTRLGRILEQELTTPTETDNRRQRITLLRYNECSAEQKAVLRFLALAKEPLPLEIKTTVTSLPFESVIPDLITNNLVQMGAFSRTIQLHPQTETWIREQINAAEAQPGHAHIARFHEERQRYDLAVTHWQQAGKMHHAATLLLAHHATVPFNIIREKIAVFRTDDVPPDVWAELCLLSGKAAVRTDDLEGAIADFRSASRAQNSELKAQAHLELIRVYRQIDIDKALVHCDMCERIVAILNPPRKMIIQAQLLIQKARITIQEKNDLEYASTCLAEAEQLIEEFKDSDKWSLIRYEWHSTQALLLSLCNKPEESAEQYWQAWQIAQSANDTENATTSTHNLGSTYFQLEQYDKALLYYEESLQYARLNHNERMIAVNQKGIGYCAFGQKKYAEAIERYLEAYTYFKKSNDSYWLGTACYDLAEALTHDHQVTAAVSYIQEGVQLSHESGNQFLGNAFVELCTKFPELAAESTPRQREIISFTRQHGAITRPQCSELTGLQARRATTLLTELVNENILVKEGKGKATRYVLPP